MTSTGAYQIFWNPFQPLIEPTVELMRPLGKNHPKPSGAIVSEAGLTKEVSPSRGEKISWTEELRRELKKFKTETERQIFISYYELVSLMIRKKLDYPELANRQGKVGHVYLVFRVNRKGTLEDLRIRQSSGNEEFDRAAKRAVYWAAPFPPLPSSLEREKIDFYLPIHFTGKGD